MRIVPVLPVPVAVNLGGAKGVSARWKLKLVGGSHLCSCGWHTVWRCHCGAVTHGPPLGDGRSLLDGRGALSVPAHGCGDVRSQNKPPTRPPWPPSRNGMLP
jgi:hypothetical protein